MDRDPIAEQDEAARVFEERTGRKSTDPAPPGFLHMRMGPNGQLQVETSGYERDPEDDFDPFKRAGIERVHRSPSEIEAPPTAVFGRFPAGTDPKAAVAEVVGVMFPGSSEVPADGYARKSHPDAIEADVIEDDPDPKESSQTWWYHCTIDPDANTMTIDLEPCLDARCLHGHVGLILPPRT